MFTVWEVMLDHFETLHDEKSWEYLQRRPAAEKMAEDLAHEFHLCPGASQPLLLELVEHFKANLELVERLMYARDFEEADALTLLDSFARSSELKSREIDFSTVPDPDTPPAKKIFEVWRQDDNGNEFLISAFRNDFEARLLRKRHERRGHKQHYWVKVRAGDGTISKPI